MKKANPIIFINMILIFAMLLTAMPSIEGCAEEKPDFELSLADAELWKESDRQGTVETVRYVTHWYNGQNGSETSKYMTVYTPYGYSEEKQYDVLILIPGMDMNENCFLNREHRYESGETGQVWLKNLLDNAIEDGTIKPMIVANINYFGATGRGNPVMSLDSNNVAKELRHDILPFLVRNYSTYAENDSEKAISEQRDHFGVFGFSYSASMIPRTVLPECMDLFAWYGASSVFHENLKNSLIEINRNISKYPVRFFYWGCGDEDDANSQTLEMYETFINGVEGFTPGINTELVVLPDTGHDAKTYDTAIYNCAKVFFRLEEESAPEEEAPAVRNRLPDTGNRDIQGSMSVQKDGSQNRFEGDRSEQYRSFQKD